MAAAFTPRDATHPVEQAEIGLAQRLAGLRDHPLLKAAEPLSKLADQPPMAALSAAATCVGVIARRPRVAETGARVLASVTLATAAKSVVKRLVRRSSPPAPSTIPPTSPPER